MTGDDALRAIQWLPDRCTIFIPDEDWNALWEQMSTEPLKEGGFRGRMTINGVCFACNSELDALREKYIND